MNKVTVDTNISIVIPTLNRSELLISSIKSLLDLAVKADEIFVIDQTQRHPEPVRQQLEEWHKQDNIHWIHQTKPSVVQAMNVGLKLATSDLVLFLDDDIIPFPDLVERHSEFHNTTQCELVAGRVIQPWDDPQGNLAPRDKTQSFNSLDNGSASHFIGANFMVQRDPALALGGFDENFKGTAHDYEREYSDRVILSGGKIAYCGKAAVQHLKEPHGGIRAFGHFLKTIRPHHAVGAYYYILRSDRVKSKMYKILQRLIQRIATKTHLREPWWIPLTLLGDILGICWAIILWLVGPKLIVKSKLP